MSLEDHYAIKENCYKDICIAREAMGSRLTSEASWRQMVKTLGLMFMWCPEDLKDTVYSQLTEAHRRALFLGIDLFAPLPTQGSSE